MKFIAALAVLGALSTAQAAKIAVIDSGLDYKHEMIVSNLWTNANEIEDNRDEDGNGYQDDVHGWNFAEQNGKIIDYKYLGTFSPDCKKYFDIQGKYFLQTALANMSPLLSMLISVGSSKSLYSSDNFVKICQADSSI